MANAGGGAAGEGEWLKVAQLRALVQAQEEDHRAKVSPGPTRFPSPRLASSSCSRRAYVRPPASISAVRADAHTSAS